MSQPGSVLPSKLASCDAASLRGERLSIAKHKTHRGHRSIHAINRRWHRYHSLFGNISNTHNTTYHNTTYNTPNDDNNSTHSSIITDDNISIHGNFESSHACNRIHFPSAVIQQPPPAVAGGEASANTAARSHVSPTLITPQYTSGKEVFPL